MRLPTSSCRSAIRSKSSDAPVPEYVRTTTYIPTYLSRDLCHFEGRRAKATPGQHAASDDVVREDAALERIGFFELKRDRFVRCLHHPEPVVADEQGGDREAQIGDQAGFEEQPEQRWA